MENGEDWIFRPILRGMCTYLDYVNVGLDLADFVFMNEALDVENENKLRRMKG